MFQKTWYAILKKWKNHDDDDYEDYDDEHQDSDSHQEKTDDDELLTDVMI